MSKLPPLPKVVKGGIANYKVKLMQLGNDRTGQFIAAENNNPEIQIEQAMPPEFRWQTFFHELLHAIEVEYEVNLKDKANDSDVNRLANGLFTFWRRNNWKLPGE